jgi:DNA polymerase I-like protein with 3'-5' exonuclease and polymerase domains
LYNGYDAAYTAILDDIISERMDDNNRRVYDDILIPALQMFLDTCDVGMSVDTTKMSGLRAELQAKMVDIQKQLEDIVRDDYRAQIVKLKEELEGAADAGVKQELEQQIKGLQLLVDSQGWFNPSSIKDDRHLVFEVLGVQTDDMNSTSRTSLEDYKGVAGVNLLLTFRETRKLLGTYVEGLVDDLVQVDDKSIVHPNIRLNGTVTGRLSSANPNFFGIPDEKGGIKKLYLPRYEGWGIGNGDGAQMEVRALGALSNDRSMIEAFIKGVDFHGSARDRLYGRGFAKKNYTHQEVLDAKTAVFGPIYGRGAESLAQQFYHSELAVLKVIAADTAKSDKDRAAAAKWLTKYPTWSRLPREEMMRRVSTAQEHIDTLWEPYPTALRWLKSNVKTGQENGELVSYYGRYRHWGLVTEEILEDIKTAGRNFPVQSASSDTNLLIMIGSYHTFSRDVYIPIFPVHDSVVFMYKLGTEKWLFPQLKEYFERRAQELLHTDMKFEYEFSLGPSWGECEIWKGGNDNGAKTSAGATTNGG